MSDVRLRGPITFFISDTYQFTLAEKQFLLLIKVHISSICLLFLFGPAAHWLLEFHP